ncbi:MAG TPA: response regulator [Vicinamibacterales bacterium]|nr:response regulator [Vicinamibacterales bacterium]
MALAFPPEPHRAPRVLLVEDHADTRLMYAEFLSSSFEVLEAADGLEALDLALRHRPDLIVTDVSLPGIDGFELVTRLRRHAVTRQTPIVCLSGYGGDVYEERARKAGCNRIVQKPCLPDELARAVHQLLAEIRGTE